jgi:transposase
MKPYPAVLRERLLRFVDAGHSQAEAARTYGVSLSSIARWRAQQAETGDLAPRARPGRTPWIGPDHASALAAQIEAVPDATLAEHCAVWAQQQGIVVSAATMSRAIRRLGITVKKSPPRQRAERDGAHSLAGAGRGPGPEPARLRR